MIQHFSEICDILIFRQGTVGLRDNNFAFFDFSVGAFSETEKYIAIGESCIAVILGYYKILKRNFSICSLIITAYKTADTAEFTF